MGHDKEVFTLRVSGGSMALPTPWFWTCGLPSCERINFCCKPLSLVICYGSHRELTRVPFFLFVGNRKPETESKMCFGCPHRFSHLSQNGDICPLNGACCSPEKVNFPDHDNTKYCIDLHHWHVECQSSMLVGILPKAVVLNQDWFGPPEDISQFLDTFLVVVIMERGLQLWSNK